MRAIDTNVLVRIAMRDDEDQAAAAEKFTAVGAWISTIVLAESVWVLAHAYDRLPEELADFIEFLIHHRTLVLQEPELAASALALFRAHPRLGFSDCLILETARRNRHEPLGTFDRLLGRLRGAQRL